MSCRSSPCFISHLCAPIYEEKVDFSLVYVSDIGRVIIGFDITFETVESEIY